MVIFFQKNLDSDNIEKYEKNENLAGCIFNVALKSHFCPPGTGEPKGVTRKPSRVYFKKNKENPLVCMSGFQPFAMRATYFSLYASIQIKISDSHLGLFTESLHTVKRKT